MSLSPSAVTLLYLFTTDHSYEYLVEGQPIGQELFHQFCQKDQVLSHCTKFLQELSALELTPDEKFSASARRLCTEYLAEGVSKGMCSSLGHWCVAGLCMQVRLQPVTEEMAAAVDTQLSASPVPRDLFKPCKE